MVVHAVRQPPAPSVRGADAGAPVVLAPAAAPSSGWPASLLRWSSMLDRAASLPNGSLGAAHVDRCRALQRQIDAAHSAPGAATPAPEAHAPDVFGAEPHAGDDTQSMRQLHAQRVRLTTAITGLQANHAARVAAREVLPTGFLARAWTHGRAIFDGSARQTLRKMSKLDSAIARSANGLAQRRAELATVDRAQEAAVTRALHADPTHPWHGELAAREQATERLALLGRWVRALDAAIADDPHGLVGIQAGMWSYARACGEARASMAHAAQGQRALVDAYSTRCRATLDGVVSKLAQPSG